MLRVLQINSCDSTASTGTVMRDIQDMCLHSGIECHIAYSVTQRSKEDILWGYHIGNWFDHKLHAVLSRVSRRQGYWSTLPTLRLIHHIDKIKPQIIHLHNLHENFINLNLLLKAIAKRNIATIVTLHDNWFYAGGCFLYEYHHCSEWQSGCKDCPLNKTGIGRINPRNTASIYQDRLKYFSAIKKLYIVGVSDWMSNEAKKSLFKDRPITTIRNGVRTDVFCPLTSEGRMMVRKHYGIQDNQFAILGPASKWLQPSNRRGLDIILKNLKSDEHLFLYGCTGKQMNQIKNDKLTLIPFTPHKNLLSVIYSMSDVFINCTHMDTCSFINIESQSCGTSVITFDNTGAKETVNQKCGFSIPTDDYEAFSKEIENIRKSQIYHSDCRDWAIERFSMESNYRAYVKLYNEIAETR